MLGHPRAPHAGRYAQVVPVESESGGSLNNAASRLDAALDPARLRNEQETGKTGQRGEIMPWERRGVVAEDPAPLALGKGPLKWWIILVVAAAPAGILLVAMTVIQRARVSPMTLAWAAAAYGFLVLMMSMTNWMVGRAKRTGEPFAPAWMWVVPVVGMVAGLAGVMVGAIPLMLMPTVVIVVMSCSGGLLFPMRKRRGFDLHCARCDYPYPFTDPAGPRAPDVCSECGAIWHDRAGLARGSKVRQSPWRIGVYVAVLTGVMGITALRGPTLRLMPTGTLIQMVTQPRAGFTMDEWAELSTRTLSQTQRERLATGLLDLRLVDTRLRKEADAWLDGEVTAGRLPQAIVDRYHGEMFQGRLVVESPAGSQTRPKVGELVVVRFDPVERVTPFTVRDPLVAFEGFERSDRAGVWIGRRDMLEHAIIMGDRARRHGGASAPELEWVPEQPARVRVRAVYWVVFMPQFAQPSPITWTEDGPVPPAGALHMERREVELWVDVAAN